MDEWIASNYEASHAFASDIMRMLDGCITTSNSKAKKNREKMWNSYHILRQSEKYVKKWKKMVTMAGGESESSTMFIQYTGHQIMKGLVQARFPIYARDSSGGPPPLTYEEANGLRYAAGYIPRMLKKTLPKSSHPLKDDIILCIYDLLDDGDGDEEDQESEDWIKSVNRGGLTLVNNRTFDVFVAIEEEVRKVLGRDMVLNDDVKAKIASSENVEFFWSLVCTDWDEESSGVLLRMVVNQYVKMRGHSYASAWVEKFKAANKKTTQKSKGLRKQLIGTKVTQSSSSSNHED